MAGFEPASSPAPKAGGVTGLPNIPIFFCGPCGNRTHHSLLAREKRQALVHDSPNKLVSSK